MDSGGGKKKRHKNRIIRTIWENHMLQSQYGAHQHRAKLQRLSGAQCELAVNAVMRLIEALWSES